MASSTAQPEDSVRLQAKGQQSPLASQRNDPEPSAPPEGVKRKGGSYFPLGYKEGFSQWWANVPAAAAEHDVLSLIPFLRSPPTQTQTGTEPPSDTPVTAPYSTNPNDDPPAVTSSAANDPHGPRQWHSNLVQLSGKNRALNEFSVERLGENIDQNLVMLHGYGAGLGFFYKNFEGLSRVAGWKVYALDLLGMGRSSRPPFKIHSKDRQSAITEAEDWFIDALEEWRVKRGIDRFTLLGHSLGGYMAVAYALKYPGHLNKLVLASPVGIPEDPYAVEAALPAPAASSVTDEFTRDATDTATSNQATKDDSSMKDNNNFMNARSKPGQISSSPGSSEAPPRRQMPKWFTYLWDANISPFSLVRWAGPLGPRFVSGWTSRRFSHLGSEESRKLHTYAYTLFKQRGSGEYALAYVLAPGAFARSPLIRRIGGVGRQYYRPNGSIASTVDAAEVDSASSSQSRNKETGYPIILMYGENDWMDISGGYAAERVLKESRAKFLESASVQERAQEKGDAKVVVIKKAGHHLYLEGWEEFNEFMRNEMVATSKETFG